MRQLFGVLVAALAMVAIPVMARAEQAGAAQEKSGSTKTVIAMGSVSAVTGNSLTVKGKTAEWTFTIDKDTSVTAKGATTKTLALKAENKASRLAEFVKVGDQVTVSYRDMGATKVASNIRVTVQAK